MDKMKLNSKPMPMPMLMLISMTIICMASIIISCIIGIYTDDTTTESTKTEELIITSTEKPEDTTHTNIINKRDLDLLAATIFYEAGSNDCTDRHQQLVAQVVLNRVVSDEFPDTIYDVIMQNRPTIQYSTYKDILYAIDNTDIIPRRCYDNALVALSGGVKCPSNVVWQANFKQGSGIYEVYETSYSTTYFCYR